MAGKAGFEPATNRLTAERTTSVLLTQIQAKKKPHGINRRAFSVHFEAVDCFVCCRSTTRRSFHC